MANRGGGGQRGQGQGSQGANEEQYPRREIPYRGSLLTRNRNHASNRAYDKVKYNSYMMIFKF